MPNILPGVETIPEDKSDVLLLNTSAIMAMVGEFDKGPDDKPILVNSKTFKRYFGEIANAPNKQSYISAAMLLKKAEGVQLMNVTKNALFGGLVVTDSTVTAFSEGVSSKDTFDFVPTIEDEDLGDGDGVVKVFSGTLNNIPVVESTLSIDYIIGGTPYTASDDGAGNITGTEITTGSIDYVTGDWSITFTTAPDDTTDILATYDWTSDYLFALIARSKRAWSDKIGIKITEIDSDENSFKVAIYELQDDGSDTFITELNVSRDVSKKDGFGKPIYIQTIFENENYLFYCVNNTSIANTTLPSVGSTITYASGGDDGDTVTSVEYAAAIAAFLPINISWDFFIGAGITEKTVLDEISDLVTERYKEAYIDTISGDYSTVVSWITSTLNIDNYCVSAFAPNQYVSYEGEEWYCPISALAGQKKANRVAGGNPYMPVAGIGSDKGTLDVIRQERVYEKAEVRELHKVGVNAIRYFPSYGNVIFSDFTLQKKTSATSYQNSVTTLNKMRTDLELQLLTLNFDVIDETLQLLCESVINAYLGQLSRYMGTIKPDWTIDFSDNTAATEDQGKYYIKVIFVYQQLAREITLKLTYTNNELFSEISGI